MHQPLITEITNKPNLVFQSGVAVPHLMWPAVYSYTYWLEKKVPGFGNEFVLCLYQKEGSWSHFIFDEDDSLRLGRKLIKKPEFHKTQFRQWQRVVSKFYRFTRKLELKGIRNLKLDYQKFLNLYLDEYGVALLTDCISLNGQQLLRNEDLRIWPPRLSFLQQEELSKLRIALKLAKKKPATSDLERHQRDFYWIKSSYKYTPTLTRSEIRKEIRAIQKTHSIAQLRQAISELKAYSQTANEEARKIKQKLTKAERLKYDLICLNAWWHDERKKANLLGSYWLNKFIVKAARKYHLSALMLQYLLPSEFSALLGGASINEAEIKQRIAGCAHYVDRRGQEAIIVGAEFKQARDDVLKRNLSDVKNNQIIGQSACPGKVTGRVKIIHDPYHDTLKAGEIIVCSMTRPDYMILVKKAAAIVTNEGGITCHAAIVSRELGIPCVIGTKIATKVLMDGDRVEVDAYKGVVRKV